MEGGSAVEDPAAVVENAAAVLLVCRSGGRAIKILLRGIKLCWRAETETKDMSTSGLRHSDILIL